MAMNGNGRSPTKSPKNLDFEEKKEMREAFDAVSLIFYNHTNLWKLIFKCRCRFYLSIFNFFLRRYLQIDKDRSGYVEFNELKDALDLVGHKLPAWKMRRLVEDVLGVKQTPNKLSFRDFERVLLLFA